MKRPSRPSGPVRISINRARLHAGLPACRIELNGKLRHAREVMGGAFVLRPVKTRGKWFIYLWTDSKVTAR